MKANYVTLHLTPANRALPIGPHKAGLFKSCISEKSAFPTIQSFDPLGQIILVPSTILSSQKGACTPVSLCAPDFLLPSHIHSLEVESSLLHPTWLSPCPNSTAILSSTQGKTKSGYSIHIRGFSSSYCCYYIYRRGKARALCFTKQDPKSCRKTPKTEWDDFTAKYLSTASLPFYH